VIDSPADEYVANAALILEDVCKIWAPGRATKVYLDGVSFAAPSGSFFAVSGPSGSGKSTLLSIVVGLDRPTAGRVIVGGRLTTDMSDYQLVRWRRQGLGIIFRSSRLFPSLTAQENVILALELGRAVPPARRRERALECLRLLDMEHRATCLPHALTSGEQQRVAIARALANDPPVIVADEPAGDLDSRDGSDVMTRLQELTLLDKTVVYATHDHEMAALASEYVELRDGRVAGRSYGAVAGLYV
jgi:ABC-type lipoprotein export system ATPase subunit